MPLTAKEVKEARRIAELLRAQADRSNKKKSFNRREAAWFEGLADLLESEDSL